MDLRRLRSSYLTQRLYLKEGKMALYRNTWVRPKVRQGEFTSQRRKPNRVHYVGSPAFDGEWRPLCQMKAQQYTLLPGVEEPYALDRCANCSRAIQRQTT